MDTQILTIQAYVRERLTDSVTSWAVSVAYHHHWYVGLAIEKRCYHLRYQNSTERNCYNGDFISMFFVWWWKSFNINMNGVIDIHIYGWHCGYSLFKQFSFFKLPVITVIKKNQLEEEDEMQRELENLLWWWMTTIDSIDGWMNVQKAKVNSNPYPNTGALQSSKRD